MTTANQGMRVEETKQIVAQRVASAIEAIAIYESISQTKQRENKIAGNASNKRKWEGDQNGSPNQQQSKEHEVFRTHAVGPDNKKEYTGTKVIKIEALINKSMRCLEHMLLGQTTRRNMLKLYL